MFTEQLREVFRYQGPVAIVTISKDGPHLVGTWTSYLEIVDNKTLAIPAWKYLQTQKNIENGSPVRLLTGTKELEGTMGPGRGFRLTGQGRFESQGKVYEKVHSRFDWARAALVVTVDRVEQLI